ncbi:MAG TPA: helix-turn-helix domain-containing GNAT family N-acetyltransferase [Solirubrobacteraceae bacterium]|jgi:DNA-binding MarR family transcriptional regulator
MPEDATIAQVRSFNRTVTQRVGALNDRYLARDRALGACRVLWEIGTEGCEVRSLRARLELDSGQTSRLLRALEDDGLIELSPSPADGRIRVARLTTSGLAERAELDDRSDELARSMVATLDDRHRAELVSAMRAVERLMTASMVELRLVDPAGADARGCLRAYIAELDRRAEVPFDPAKGTSAEPHELRPPAGAFLVAYLRDDPIGCGALKHHQGGPSEIKRMWVAESARGLGIGRRLLERLEQLARDGDAPAVRLDTNKALVEAIAMYRSSGYREIPRFNSEPFAHHWFEKTLR